MTTRKEERERMRQERLAAQQAASSSEKRRLYLGYGVAGLIVAAIVAGIVAAVAGGGDDANQPESGDFPERAFIQPQIGSVPPGAEPDAREGVEPPAPQTAILEDAAKTADCDLQLDLPEEGNKHFGDDQNEANYKTTPPTSGDHYGNNNETGSGALADGAYLNTLPIARVLHAMEHGRVAMHYSPDLPEEEQLELKGLFEESPEGVILMPNPDMPFDVAITAWTQLAGCDSYEGAATLDVLRSFRDVYRGQGPEPFPLAA